MGKRLPDALPPWLKVGALVNYHSIIGGPVTSPRMVVRAGPQLMGDSWVVWLKGKSGCVHVDAVSCAATLCPHCGREMPAGRAGHFEGER